MTQRRIILAAAVVVLVAVAVLGWVLALHGGGGPESNRELDLTFEGDNPFQNHGTADVQPHVVTQNGGQAQIVAGRSGGHAVRLPAYQPTDEPRAIIAVPDDPKDDLSPGSGDFTFGADFKLDQQSKGSATDNGDNLIQRGLYTEPMQFKIEMDSDKPACRIKGTDGDVIVRGVRTIDPDTWYRVACSRRGDTVTLKVTDLEAGASWTLSRSGAIGDVSSTTSLLTVGGKTDERGDLIPSADQFNGIVDNAFYEKQ
jgi:hypothetical protein